MPRWDKKNRCSNCQWYADFGVENGREATGEGTCRENSPQRMTWPESGWPTTDVNRWCGRYQKIWRE